MKKQVKVVVTILMVVAILTILASAALASQEKTVLDNIKDGGTTVDTESVQNFGKAIVSVVRVVGVIVAVVVLLILGIKYMVGSAEERAEYKKTMVPYIIGAVLIFASTTLVGVVYDLSMSLNNTSSSSSSSTGYNRYGPGPSEGGIYGGPVDAN